MGTLASSILVHALPTLLKAAEAGIEALEPQLAAFLQKEIAAAFTALNALLTAKAKTTPAK